MIRRGRVTLTLLLGLVLMAGAGQATALVTTLVSPPLVPEGDSRLGCAIINISTQAREVLVSVFSREGILLESVSFTLAPGPEAVVTVPTSEEPRYCAFVVEGGRQHFRAAVRIQQPGVGTISTLPAE
jgi:hypothetical protein